MACANVTEKEGGSVASVVYYPHAVPSSAGDLRCSSAFSVDCAWTRLLSRGRTPTLRDVPKVDLHCHLNGSISAPLLSHMEQLQELARGGNEANPLPLRCGNTDCTKGILEQFRDASERMKYCFTLFDNVYRVMTNAAFTRMAVQDLLLHSAAENMFVLEIRSSLRDGIFETPSAAVHGVKAKCITKKAYLETVIATAEHLMNGGVVDFETGELLPVGPALSPAWWSHFCKLYGFLAAEAEETVETLWASIRDCLMRRMHLRLLVSINRGQSAEAAMEAVKLAKELQRDQLEHFFASRRAAAEEAEGRCALHNGNANNAGEDGSCRTPSATLLHDMPTSSLRDMIRRTCWVSGIDFSGYCCKNHFSDFLQALTEARCGGSSSYSTLGITLHAGEKSDARELAAMIQFGPERWGHLVFTDPANLATIVARHDAIELCITSNATTGGYTEVAHHHLGGILAVQQQQQQQQCAEGKEVEDVAPDMVEWLTDKASFLTAMQSRLERRLARWRHRQNQPAATGCGETQKIPNVSFHTDDRGIFGTSMTSELRLLLQHPSMANGSTVNALAVKTVLALQRLSLPHVFELPLEVVYYCTHLEGAGENQSGNGDCISLACVKDQVEALGDEARAELSYVELCWLMEDFDAFFV